MNHEMVAESREPVCSVVFNSSIEELADINPSFARGILRIAYHGKNRNRMLIPKKAFIDAIPSAFNCPVVCHYDRATDSIGAHDMEVVRKNDDMKLVNITDPVGVVPESARMWWSTVTEDNGETHEYLCTDIYLWKRQEAYAHLKENGITSESMEIQILSSKMQDDGYMQVDKFEFLAFCLLESAEPCFESAGIELFSLADFKTKYTEMMNDFKREFSQVITASADDIKDTFQTKGGACDLDVNELMSKYGLSAEDVDFDTQDMDSTEIEQRFARIRSMKDGTQSDFSDTESDDHSAEQADSAEVASLDEQPQEDDHKSEATEQLMDDDDDEALPGKVQQYSLTMEQFFSELWEAVSAVTYTDPTWGEMSRYWYVDCDRDAGEVYVIDFMDGKLYGMPFAMNGDNVVIDYTSAKRKKTTYVDFDEGDATFSCKTVFESVMDTLKTKFEPLDKEVRTLRQFKQSVDDKMRLEAENEVFSRFPDLAGMELFEALKDECKELTVEQLEEKCFAIRGRMTTAKFSANDAPKPMRLPIEGTDEKNDEPYGGIFVKYGIVKH